MTTQTDVLPERKPKAEPNQPSAAGAPPVGLRLLSRELIALGVAAILVAVCFLLVDRQVATYAATLHLYNWLSASSLQLPVLVVAAVAAVAIGGVCYIVQPRTSLVLKGMIDAAMLSGLAMSWGLCLTELLLKPVFGRAVPQLYFHNGAYGFYWLQGGDPFRSFPSGHAVQITSVATVLWMLYPRFRLLYLLAVAAVFTALILGEWHFVSDLLAGSMIGVTGGVLVTRAWLARSISPFSRGPKS